MINHFIGAIGEVMDYAEAVIEGTDVKSCSNYNINKLSRFDRVRACDRAIKNLLVKYKDKSREELISIVIPFVPDFIIMVNAE